MQVKAKNNSGGHPSKIGADLWWFQELVHRFEAPFWLHFGGRGEPHGVIWDALEGIGK